MATVVLKLNNFKPICSSIRSQYIPAKHKSKNTSFPNFYVNPIFRKEEQDELFKSGEVSKLTNVPVRPPATYQSCSVYNDDLVNKVVNHVMMDGKKNLARGLVEKAFVNIKRAQIQKYHSSQTEEEKASVELDPRAVLHKAINNSKPLLTLSPVKRGGITYQVPGPITEKRSLFLAVKWLIEAAQDKERTVHFPEKFAWELLDAAGNTGKVVKRKQDLHRQCEANRAYAHYRWM